MGVALPPPTSPPARYPLHVRASPALRSLPPLRRGALALCALAFLVNALLGDQPVAARLVLGPAFLAEPWQPLTAVLFFPGRLDGLVATVLVQWILGSAVEKAWGPARYLSLVLGSAFAGYLLTALLGLALPALLAAPLGGTAPADLAAIAAFGVLYARQPLRFFGALDLSGRSLAILLGAVTLLAPLLRGAPWPAALPGLIALLVALLVVARPWRPRPRSGKLTQPRPRHLRVVH